MTTDPKTLSATEAAELTEAYLAAHCDPEPPELHDLYRHTNLSHLYPHMCSGHVQGRLLSMLSFMIRPRRVLELGTYTGYSALCLAEGMPVGGVLDTVEIDDEMADELRATFAANPRPAEIRLHVGDALEVVPRLEGEWNLVFIDANKRNYRQYFEMVVDRVPSGGFILADNTLWGGKMPLSAGPDGAAAFHDAQSRAIAEFNDAIASDPRVAKVILPVRDGLTICRRL